MLDSSPTFTEVSTEVSADPKDINTPEPKSSDGDFNNLKNKKSSRKTRREMPWKSTQESSLTKEEEPWTELSLNTLRTNLHEQL